MPSVPESELLTPQSETVEAKRVVAIAPWWHTALVLGQFIALACIGPAVARQRSMETLAVFYVGAVMGQGLQLSAVVAGIYDRRQFFLGTLRGGLGGWWSEIWRGGVLYLATMAMFVVAAVAFHMVKWQPGFERHAFDGVMPVNAGQVLLWLGVCMVIGFCEEHIFRGYLLQQMIAWGESLGCGRAVTVGGAVLLTSVLFGSLHLYEGTGGAVLIGLLGVMYSAVALWRGNLRAVMVAHVLQDFLTMMMLMARHHHGAR
jgi:membrane protease YdiL (CAAX protease family)